MLQIVQAYDRSPVADVATDDADALEAKFDLAVRAFRDRNHRLEPHERIGILSRLASLMDAERDRLSRLIAQEGGKPPVDAIVETSRAIDVVRNAERVVIGQKGLAPGFGHLLEARSGGVGATIRTVISYCFSFDPAGKTYVFKLLKVSARIVFLSAGGFLIYLMLAGRSRRHASARQPGIPRVYLG